MLLDSVLDVLRLLDELDTDEVLAELLELVVTDWLLLELDDRVDVDWLDPLLRLLADETELTLDAENPPLLVDWLLDDRVLFDDPLLVELDRLEVLNPRELVELDVVIEILLLESVESVDVLRLLPLLDTLDADELPLLDSENPPLLVDWLDVERVDCDDRLDDWLLNELDDTPPDDVLLLVETERDELETDETLLADCDEPVERLDKLETELTLDVLAELEDTDEVCDDVLRLDLLLRDDESELTDEVLNPRDDTLDSVWLLVDAELLLAELAELPVERLDDSVLDDAELLLELEAVLVDCDETLDEN